MFVVGRGVQTIDNESQNIRETVAFCMITTCRVRSKLSMHLDKQPWSGRAYVACRVTGADVQDLSEFLGIKIPPNSLDLLSKTTKFMKRVLNGHCRQF